MELIPIEHTVSSVVEESLKLAETYENAGMEKKARLIRKDCVVAVCDDNDIEIIQGNNVVIIGRNRIYNWDGFDWELEEVSSLSIDVPVAMLKKMGKIREQERFRIAIPSGPDPVLLYKLPFFSGDAAYIELGRWE